MKQLLPIVMALGLTAVAAVAQTPLAPQEFAAQAAFSNMFGVESATLALHKTTSPKIKSFAHRLANDHATTGSSLRQITARRSDIALPERPDARHLDLLRDLAEKKGEDFDRAYVKAQQTAHGEATALLAAYAQNGTDPELKAFAAKALPTFQELDRQAKELPSP
jgi:putative membrane protein